MKKIALMATLAAVVVMTPMTVPPTFAQGVSITVGAENQKKWKTYVTEKKVKKVTVKERKVGAVIPADVELVAVPGDWGSEYTKYRYVYADDDILLVDPDSRKVIYVVD